MKLLERVNPIVIRRKSGVIWQLKMPWHHAYFSERNGYEVPKLKLFNFRLFRHEARK